MRLFDVTTVFVYPRAFVGAPRRRYSRDYYTYRWLLQHNPKTSLSTGFESLVVVLRSSRSRAFKLVALTRLTPIPFGVQVMIIRVSGPL